MPLDVVKTRMQIEPRRYGGAGVIDAAKGIYRDEGAGALVQGAAPTLLGYALSGALAFGLTDTLSRVLKARPGCARDALEMRPRWS